jgi:hypothetical protein
MHIHVLIQKFVKANTPTLIHHVVELLPNAKKQCLDTQKNIQEVYLSIDKHKSNVDRG